jgi:hypothetical protein
MGGQQCGACGGYGVTEKIEYTYERDAGGNDTAVEHRYISPCTSCGGSGRIG